MTEFHAKLLTEVGLPRPDWSPAKLGIQRTGNGILVGTADGDSLAVHNVQRVLAGDLAPAARFPVPWAEWERDCQCSFTSDLTTAVFPGRDEVVAVGSDGAVRWTWPHESGLSSRSTLVAGDRVWVVLSRPGGFDWAVLDLRDGRPLGQVSIVDWGEYPSDVWQLSAGPRVCLELGFLDFASVHWGQIDGTTITAGLIGQADAFLTDISHDGEHMFFVMKDYGEGEICTFPDAITEWDVDGEEDWYPNVGGFVDADTVVAMREEDDQQWLLRVAERRLGRLHYPSGTSPANNPWPLGDGTWLTSGTDRLQRWAVNLG